jgi:AraC-like DNA-binding protein
VDDPATWEERPDLREGVIYVRADRATEGTTLVADSHLLMWTVRPDADGVRSYFHRGRLRSTRADAVQLYEPGDLHVDRKGGPAVDYRLLFLGSGTLERWCRGSGVEPRMPVAQLAAPELLAALRALDGAPEELWSEALATVAGALDRALGGPQERRPVCATAVKRARDHVQDRWFDPPSLDELAAEVGASKYHLLRSFRQAYGVTPAELGRLLRASQGKHALERGESCGDAARIAGFADQAHFSRTFKEVYKTTPTAYLLSARLARR